MDFKMLAGNSRVIGQDAIAIAVATETDFLVMGQDAGIANSRSGSYFQTQTKLVHD